MPTRLPAVNRNTHVTQADLLNKQNPIKKGEKVWIDAVGVMTIDKKHTNFEIYNKNKI